MIPVETQREIEALMVSYATAADTRDMALMAACFTADVTADYGENIGRFDGRDAFVGHLSAMLGSCGPTLHYISNVVLTEAEEGLNVRTYTQAVVIIPGVDAPIRTAGTYDDHVVRTVDGWQIASRVYRGIA